MGVSPAIFESAGQISQHYVPGVYSRSSNITSPSGVSSGNLVILGNSMGGKPLELLQFNSLSEAKDTLIDGELLKGIGYAFKGSNVYIPQKVYAMRVNNGLQSTVTLKNSETDVLKIKSSDYGSHCNQIKIMVSNGSLGANYRKIEAGYKDYNTVIDNVGKQSIFINYGGEGDKATCTITTEGMTLQAFEENVEITEEKLEISFEDYPNLQDVVTKINDSGIYSANLLDADSQAKSNELDSCTSTVISEYVNDEPLTDGATFYSNLQAFIDAIKSIPLFDDVEILSIARLVPDTTGDVFTYFTGGSSGTNSWALALEKLETEDIQIIATPSTDNLVHAQIVAHCIEMSNVNNRKERTCFLGTNYNISDDDGINYAKSLNSKFASLVIDSGVALNPINNTSENIGGSIIACMLAGMESAMSVAEPLTYKTINVLSFTKKRTISNIENLIKNGVTCCNPNPENVNEFICIRSITTFQGNGDLISVERSMTREALFMDRDLRNAFATGIGGTNNTSESAIIQTLKDKANEWKISGLIIPKGTDNVWNISVRFSGDKVYLQYARYLTAPRNFVFITAVNHVYETTIEL